MSETKRGNHDPVKVITDSPDPYQVHLGVKRCHMGMTAKEVESQVGEHHFHDKTSCVSKFPKGGFRRTPDVGGSPTW